MEQTENKSSKKLIIFEIVCVLIMIGLIGYTYSYFNVTTTNNTTITGKAASLSLTLNVSKVAPSNTNGLIPQLDEFITSAVIGRNGSCIDDNNNNVCQVYKITVKNTSAVSLYANGTVTLDNKNNPNLKWAQISGTSSPTLVSSINTPSTVTLVENELFTASEEKIYYIVVWISETGEAQYDTGSFTGTVTFGDANKPTAEATLNYLKSLGFEGELSDIVLTSFTTTSKLDGTTGIYEAEDDLGISYYFRGDVENNYVKFGKWNEEEADVYLGFDSEDYVSFDVHDTLSECENSISHNYDCTLLTRAGEDMYWRIVRINGDGSIRMIYDGTYIYYNNESGKDNFIVKSGFASKLSRENSWSGYMNGSVDGTNFPSGGTVSTTLIEAQTNLTNSAIKSVIDNWYEENILNSDYDDKVVDAIYCNDRSIYTGTGIGTNTTYYNAYNRLEENSTALPILNCPQENDKFSVYTNIGNGDLTYPVGLLTADELVFAGAYSEIENDEYYLYHNHFEGSWSMTPRTNGWHFANCGSYGLYYDARDHSAYYVTPVISISPDAIQYGDGTAENPFRMTSEV